MPRRKNFRPAAGSTAFHLDAIQIPARQPPESITDPHLRQLWQELVNQFHPGDVTDVTCDHITMAVGVWAAYRRAHERIASAQNTHEANQAGLAASRLLGLFQKHCGSFGISTKKIAQRLALRGQQSASLRSDPVNGDDSLLAEPTVPVTIRRPRGH